MDEGAIKEDISLIIRKHGLKGYLLLYLDDNKIRFTGDMPASALGPMLVDALAVKFGSKGKGMI